MLLSSQQQGLIRPDDEFTLSHDERKQSSVLIVEPDANTRNNMRLTIKSLGYGNISDAVSHGQALDRLKERAYTFVLFDAQKSNVPPVDFLAQLLKQDQHTTAIPMSGSPRVDDVFNLLVIGAKGFLVKPFTVNSVDESIIWAHKGEPIAEVVLNAKDRNQALVAVMMAALDSVSTLMRQAREFDTAKRELPKAYRRFKRSAELAKTFCKGSDENLIDAISEFCIMRGEGPATRLGRLRQRLKKK